MRACDPAIRRSASGDIPGVRALARRRLDLTIAAMGCPEKTARSLPFRSSRLGGIHSKSPLNAGTRINCPCSAPSNKAQRPRRVLQIAKRTQQASEQAPKSRHPAIPASIEAQKSAKRTQRGFSRSPRGRKGLTIVNSQLRTTTDKLTKTYTTPLSRTRAVIGILASSQSELARLSRMRALTSGKGAVESRLGDQPPLGRLVAQFGATRPWR
jgi:hypothetical protein